MASSISKWLPSSALNSLTAADKSVAVKPVSDILPISPSCSLIAAVKSVADVFKLNEPTSVCNWFNAPVIVLLLSPESIELILSSPIWSSCSLTAAVRFDADVPKLLAVTSPISLWICSSAPVIVSFEPDIPVISTLPIWSSCSLIAPLTVLAVVAIAAAVIVPSSESCSLIANTTSLAEVVKFSTVPISSCNSLIAATKSSEKTLITFVFAAGVVSSI